MDPEYLTQVTWQAGYHIGWPALTGLAARHPEQVLDWVCAAGEYAAADTSHRLLTAAAAALRDEVAGTEPAHLYQHADHLSEVCDLLTQADQARADALDKLCTCCGELAALDPAALRADPDGCAGPAPPTWPTPAHGPRRPTLCRGLPPGPRRRPHTRPPPTP
jgi:hypothetical protein